MWLNHSKDVCACFNLHQLRFQCINSSCVEVVALIRRVFLHLIAKMNYWFLEQQINIKFCVKLGKNASDTCTILSPRLMGEKLWRIQLFLSGINGSKRACMPKSKIMTMLITFFNIKAVVHFEFIPQGQSTKLIMCKYWNGYMKMCIQKGLNFGPMIGFSIMTMLQLTRHSLSGSLWPKNLLLKWNTHSIPLIRLWMTSGCFQK
jgi:hypothetical protein